MAEVSRIQTHFLVCTNARPDSHPLPSCAPRGGAAVFEAFTRELAKRGFPKGVKVTATGCLTPCQHGPNVVVYPEGVWYAGVNATDVPALLAAHLDSPYDSERDVRALLLPKEVQVT